MNINAKDNFGETAFYMARSYCRLEIEKILKKYGETKFLVSIETSGLAFLSGW